MRTAYLFAPAWQTVGPLPVDRNTSITEKKTMGYALPSPWWHQLSDGISYLMASAITKNNGGKYWKPCRIGLHTTKMAGNHWTTGWTPGAHMESRHSHMERHWNKQLYAMPHSAVPKHSAISQPTQRPLAPSPALSETSGHRRYPHDLPVAMQHLL